MISLTWSNATYTSGTWSHLRHTYWWYWSFSRRIFAQHFTHHKIMIVDTAATYMLQKIESRFPTYPLQQTRMWLIIAFYRQLFCEILAVVRKQIDINRWFQLRLHNFFCLALTTFPSGLVQSVVIGVHESIIFSKRRYNDINFFLLPPSCVCNAHLLLLYIFI